MEHHRKQSVQYHFNTTQRDEEAKDNTTKKDEEADDVDQNEDIREKGPLSIATPETQN